MISLPRGGNTGQNLGHQMNNDRYNNNNNKALFVYRLGRISDQIPKVGLILANKAVGNIELIRSLNFYTYSPKSQLSPSFISSLISSGKA